MNSRENDLLSRLADADRELLAGEIPPSSGSLSPLARHEMTQAVRAYLARYEIAIGDAAARAGLDAATAKVTLERRSGNADFSLDAALFRLNQFVSDDAKAREVEKSARTGAIAHTVTVLKVRAAIQQLSRFADMGIVVGAAGLGKTASMLAAAREFPWFFHISITNSSRSIGAMLNRVRRAVCPHEPEKQRVAFDALVARLRKPRGVACRYVLGIDEADRLTPRALRELCSIHDAAECSVLLVGATSLKSRVSDDEDPLFAQISSRVGLRVDLNREILARGPNGRGARYFTIDDIRAAFRSPKLKLHSDAARLLMEIANELGKGHMRRAARIFQWACAVARHHSRDTITADDVLAARELVEGEAPAAAARDETGPQHSKAAIA